jgi:hypothetical protein
VRSAIRAERMCLRFPFSPDYSNWQMSGAFKCDHTIWWVKDGQKKNHK